MGYDISSYDEENKRNIAGMEAPANCFEKIKYNGYDWFGLINASDCDGVVSGLGIEKYIQLKDLKRAYEILITMDKDDKLKNSLSGPLMDPMGISKMMERQIQERINISMFDKIMLKHQMIEGQNRQAMYIIDELKDYMKYCIEWCENNNRSKILMYFG
ncbi:MAG: hypothetical protein ACFFDB_19120 [Promethearchaeota archaeon]